MGRRSVLFVFLVVVLAALPPPMAQRRDSILWVPLPTSKVLTAPSPGLVGATNGFPATIALSPDGRYAALLDGGYGTQETLGRQSIAILDLQTNQLADFPDDRLGPESRQNYFLGLSFSSDGKHLYASMGSMTDPTGQRPNDTGNGVAVYGFRAGKVTPERFIPIPPQGLARGKKVAMGLHNTPPLTAVPYPAGLAVISAGGHDQLLVANDYSDNAVLLDPTSRQILRRFDLSISDLVPSAFPYTVVTTRDGRRAWCSLWNASQIAELDLAAGRVARWIPLLQPHDPIAPGSHPTAILLSADERFLYVALANADRVAVVSTADGKAVRYLATSAPAQKYAGSYPNALAQSSDGKRLFVADASLDAVAVFDTSELDSHQAADREKPQPALGLIPTDWYPSALAAGGDDLLVATAKGKGSGPNNGVGKLNWEREYHKPPYIASLLKGSIARLNIPQTLKRLDELTRQVEQDNLLIGDPGTIRFARHSNPIAHVIYIIKENRTYDQVLGDLRVGNGDPSLTMYGEDVTPNEHKLALQFGVLDNFYDSGEVSGDGHLWSTAAITTDYNEKTWQLAYRGLERTYDYGGAVAGELPLEYNLPDVDDPSTGFLWDNVAHHGLTYRVYGEFINTEWCNVKGNAASPERRSSSRLWLCPQTEVHKGTPLPANIGHPRGSPSPWPWPVPMLARMRSTKAVLRDHFDPLYPGFNIDYPDQLRADEFLNEFEAYVHARKNGVAPELPSFILLQLPDDHTGGTRPGRPSPAASVADNDLALARIVEAVSHSPYWDDTAIFVVEDDAQDGADHVDAHRSIAFLVSKYSPGSAAHPFVDSRFYTTVNMVHTMEMLLGLPPMNQNDGYASVMAPLFSGSGDQPPFMADRRNLENGLLFASNAKNVPGAAESSRMNFTRPDAVDTTILNAILWHDRKGDTPVPAARYTRFFQRSGSVTVPKDRNRNSP